MAELKEEQLEGERENSEDSITGKMQVVHVTPKGTVDQKDSDNDAPFLIAFVNFNSGGKMGSRIARVLRRELGESHVFNLADGGPAIGLQKFPEKKDLRVLVAGGDGTVNWILSTINNLKMNPQPAVGILPLGTGNDCALQFGWGKQFPGFRRLRQMTREMLVKECPISLFDLWEGKIVPKQKKTSSKISLMPGTVQEKKNPLPSDLESGEKLNERKEEKTADIDLKEEKTEPRLFKFTYNNYLSFGIDAQISHTFHHHRENNRRCYCCRCCNLTCYGFAGFLAWFCCRSKRLPMEVEIRRTLDSDWEQLQLPNDFRGLVFLNLPTYAGGRHIWGKPDTKEKFVSNSVGDKLLEILAVKSTFHLGRMVSECGTGVRLAQATQVRLTTSVPAYVQLDGEPWEEVPCYMEVSHLNQIRMLTRFDEERVCCTYCRSRKGCCGCSST